MGFPLSLRGLVVTHLPVHVWWYCLKNDKKLTEGNNSVSSSITLILLINSYSYLSWIKHFETWEEHDNWTQVQKDSLPKRKARFLDPEILACHIIQFFTPCRNHEAAQDLAKEKQTALFLMGTEILVIYVMEAKLTNSGLFLPCAFQPLHFPASPERSKEWMCFTIKVPRSLMMQNWENG